MIAIKTALRGAEGKTSLDGIAIDAALRTTLERLMPIYQKHCWPEHDRANREWIAMIPADRRSPWPSIEPGARAMYDVTWPVEPIPVDVVVIAE